MEQPRIAPAGSQEPGERQPSAPELPAEHALLGLLALRGGTAHGYELARQFRRGQLLGDVIHLESAMLYKHLKKLARLGWLTMTLEEQSPRPPRQVCRLTPAGEAELRRWLAEPVARTREIRLEFLVKLYFARKLDPALATRLASEQAAVMTLLATSLTDQLACSGPSGDDQAFARLVLELRLKQTRAAQEWLGEVVAAFQSPSEPAAGRTGRRRQSVGTL